MHGRLDAFTVDASILRGFAQQEARVFGEGGFKRYKYILVL